jgi:hypothetical protein
VQLNIGYLRQLAYNHTISLKDQVKNIPLFLRGIFLSVYYA